MGVMFNAEEIFQMAIQIEENGAAFYRKAAELKKDANETEFLEKLAVMEDGHATTFSEMKKRLSEEEKGEAVFDPLGESALYLEAMADSHRGEGSRKASESISADTSLKEILELAIGLEKESILFYIGLRDMTPERLGKEKVDEIIKEERDHIAVLRKELTSLQVD